MIDYLNTLNVHQHKLSLRNSLACYAVFWCVCQAWLCLLCNDHVNIGCPIDALCCFILVVRKL